MGQCCCSEGPSTLRFALKFPHGARGATLHGDKFVPCDINAWLQTVFVPQNAQLAWTSWVVYNDDAPPVNGGDAPARAYGGHCKGIVAWNDSHMAWLVHSVPNFPAAFAPPAVGPIDRRALVYGQSFLCVEFPADAARRAAVLRQLRLMRAHVTPGLGRYGPAEADILRGAVAPGAADASGGISTVQLTDAVSHIAKPPGARVDVYEHVARLAANELMVKTWVRGQALPDTTGDRGAVRTVARVAVNSDRWDAGQDHSKWAVHFETPTYAFVGDLNRMASQLARGGGGLLCRDAALAAALRSIIDQ